MTRPSAPCFNTPQGQNSTHRLQPLHQLGKMVTQPRGSRPFDPASPSSTTSMPTVPATYSVAPSRPAIDYRTGSCFAPARSHRPVWSVCLSATGTARLRVVVGPSHASWRQLPVPPPATGHSGSPCLSLSTSTHLCWIADEINTSVPQERQSGILLGERRFRDRPLNANGLIVPKDAGVEL